MSETASGIDIDIAALAKLIESDPRRAADELRKLAKAGDNNARLVLAQMLSEGRGVPADSHEAFHLYALAANGGNVTAMNQLGRCHELGMATPIDMALAATWYRRAAEADLAWGMYNFANLLATGRGVTADAQQAFAWYRRAALLGHAKSMNLIGRHYEEGLLVDADRSVAVHWYRRSAHAGDFRGQASYAAVLAEAGRIDEAEQWLRVAIARGSASFLAHLHQSLNSKGVHPRLQLLLGSIEDHMSAA